MLVKGATGNAFCVTGPISSGSPTQEDGNVGIWFAIDVRSTKLVNQQSLICGVYVMSCNEKLFDVCSLDILKLLVTLQVSL